MKKLPLGIRFLLALISLILCVALFATTLVTTLLGDLSVAFQKDNLKKLLTEALFTTSTIHRPAPQISGNGTPGIRHPMQRLDDFTIPEGVTIPEGATIPGDFVSGDLGDVLGGEGGDSSALVEFIYNTVTEQFQGEDVVLPPLEEVQQFVEESTLDDFLADKSASLISDIITGENTTTITTEEIQTLLQENAQLIEDTFEVEISEDVITEVVAEIEKVEIVQQIQEEGVNSVLQELVDNKVITIPGMLPSQDLAPETPGEGSSVNTSTPDMSSPMGIINALRSIVSTETLLAMIGVCLVLIGLLLLVNMKQIWVGIRDAGITVTVVGVIFSAITFAAWFSEDMLKELLAEAGPVAKIVLFIVNLTAPIHIGVLALGIVLIVVSCVVKSLLKKKALKAAAAAEIPAEEAAAIEEAAEEEAPAEEAAAEEEAPVAEAAAEEEVPAEETAEEEAPAETV